MGNCSNSPDITIASAGADKNLTTYFNSNIRPPAHNYLDRETLQTLFLWTTASTFTLTKLTVSDLQTSQKSTFNALPIPTDVFVGEREFGKVIGAATACFIPAERIRELWSNFPAKAAVLANECDCLRQFDHCHPAQGFSI